MKKLLRLCEDIFVSQKNGAALRMQGKQDNADEK